MSKFLELIKRYWGYFMTLIAIGTFVWTLGVKSERKVIETVNIKEDIIEVKNQQVEQNKQVKNQNQQLDSLLIIVKDVRKEQSGLRTNQNAMRKSYVEYLSKDPRLTKEDFIKYMNGIEFQIVPPDKDSSDTITIQPKK